MVDKRAHAQRLLCPRMFATAAAIFSILLVVTGAAKIARPRDVEKALAGLGLPRVPGSGVTIGLVEVLIGASSLVLPQALWVQTLMFAVFALWVRAALRSDTPLASCGCLGRPDTPPSASHLALNVVAAFVSLGAVLGDPLSLDRGIGLVSQLAVVATGVFLAYVVLTDAARLVGVRRS